LHSAEQTGNVAFVPVLARKLWITGNNRPG
jgi:hypothetical protein